MKKTAEDFIKQNLSVTNWNFLHHVLHSGEVYKQLQTAMHQFAAQEVAEATKWISVAERLPELNTNVLVYQRTINHDWKVSISDYSKYGFTSCAGVTHWQALPQSPTP